MFSPNFDKRFLLSFVFGQKILFFSLPNLSVATSTSKFVASIRTHILTIRFIGTKTVTENILFFK